MAKSIPKITKIELQGASNTGYAREYNVHLPNFKIDVIQVEVENNKEARFSLMDLYQQATKYPAKDPKLSKILLLGVNNQGKSKFIEIPIPKFRLDTIELRFSGHSKCLLNLSDIQARLTKKVPNHK